jgi:hypothetical protein
VQPRAAPLFAVLERLHFCSGGSIARQTDRQTKAKERKKKRIKIAAACRAWKWIINGSFKSTRSKFGGITRVPGWSGAIQEKKNKTYQQNAKDSHFGFWYVLCLTLAALGFAASRRTGPTGKETSQRRVADKARTALIGQP